MSLWVSSASSKTEEEFNRFFDSSVQIAEKHNIGKPELPRYRRRPSRFEDGSNPHEFTSAKAYYRQIFFEACDLLSVELKDRFEDQHNYTICVGNRANFAEGSKW